MPNIRPRERGGPMSAVRRALVLSRISFFERVFQPDHTSMLAGGPTFEGSFLS
jgi:hypothetical protein